MSAASEIYAFETIFPDALKTVLEAATVAAFTLTDSPDFQKDRPRVEIVFKPGPGTRQWRQLGTGADGAATPRETAWAGEFELFLVTAAEVTTHMEYLAQVRSTLHGVMGQMNGGTLTKHFLNPFIRDGGTQSNWTPQDGCFVSRMTVGVDFSIQDDAWATLT